MSKESVKKISLMNRVVSLPAEIRFRHFENTNHDDACESFNFY